MRLKNKRALITGGGTGIGKAIATRFADEGAKVVITGRRMAKLEETAAASENILSLVADIATEDGPSAIIAETVSRLGGIDILVNNAGLFDAISIDDSTDEVFDREFSTNVRGLFRLTRSALPELRKGTGPNIVNIGSILSFVGVANTSVYCGTKGAVVQFSRSMAVELGSEGIRCNCVCPGLIRTELTEGLMADQEFLDQILPDYPLQRFGETMDVAKACLFLASEEASWLTGVVLPVDGGYTAR